MLLFETVHGSHLYGLAHRDSDKDTYRVIATEHRTRLKNAKHKIAGLDDVMTVDFCTWMAMCERSVPQALEAMYSNKSTFDKIEAFRRGFLVSRSTLQDTYRRTAKAFAMEGRYKTRRHALRLCVNMWEAWEYGRFNPTLTPKMIYHIEYRMSKEYYDDLLQDFLDGNI